MKFLIDNQLPIALARFLESKGFDSIHVVDIHLDEASDIDIWEYAKQHDCVIVSKDVDFLQLSLSTSGKIPTVVWVRLGNCRKVELIAAFEKILPDLAEVLKTQKIIEIR